MGHGTNRVEDMTSPNTATARETIVEIHSVCLPPKKTTFQKLKKRFADVFFPDDPLERFRNQTWRNKVILGLQSLFPIFTWGSQYDLKLFRSDVISGLTIASLAIPQVHHLTILFIRKVVFCCFLVLL